MWFRRKRSLAKVLIPLVTVILLLSITSITRLSIEAEFHGQESALNTPIHNKLTKRNVLNTQDDQYTSFESILTNNTNLPFRFFIYDLPESFNYDILDYFHKSKLNMCYNFSYYGMGSEVFETGHEDGSFSVYDTNQFSLEVIIHKKLKKNALRTRNPEKADLFYIPAYIGLLCISQRWRAPEIIERLKHFLTNSRYFSSGKPHFSATSKIQKEMANNICPYLSQSFTKNITFLSIEKQTLSNVPNEVQSYLPKSSILVAPYPTYGHFKQSMETDLSTIPINDRDVLILLPVSERRTNPLRSQLMDQFEIKTKLAYSRFKMCNENGPTKMVLFYTNDCSWEARNFLIPWMQHSIFCLQPPGDSPSRKSFYDSIMSGCIPVILTQNNGHNPYAFQELIDYETFSISVEIARITEQGHNIYNILHDISTAQIQRMQDQIKKIARYMQYSIPSGKIERESDAVQLIFQQLSSKFNLAYDKHLQWLH